MIQRICWSLIFLAVVESQALAESQVLAESAAAINSGDTAWVLLCAGMVGLMTPGLACFYAGLVRAKNVLSTLCHSFFCMGLVTVIWITLGYSLSFSHGTLFIGGFDYFMLAGVGEEPLDGTTIPHSVFMIFQLMFAIITPAIISGAFAERIKFSAFVAFTTIWSLVVYAPICHWVWGPGGWIGALGALDFAGGTVVHISSGTAALAMAMVLGPRIGVSERPASSPHNLPLTLLGVGLLWFGWFGFNAGSALAADGIAANAFVTTQIGAASAMVAWYALEKLNHGRSTAIGIASSAIAGLVAITPACGFVGPASACAIGFVAAIVCFHGVEIKRLLKLDDSLDAFGIHAIGGAWGALATGLFAVAALAGTSGLFEGGNVSLVGVQLLSIGVIALYSFAMTYGIARILDRSMGLRVTQTDEINGLDLRDGETGYAI